MDTWKEGAISHSPTLSSPSIDIDGVHKHQFATKNLWHSVKFHPSRPRFNRVSWIRSAHTLSESDQLGRTLRRDQNLLLFNYESDKFNILYVTLWTETVTPTGDKNLLLFKRDSDKFNILSLALMTKTLVHTGDKILLLFKYEKWQIKYIIFTGESDGDYFKIDLFAPRIHFIPESEMASLGQGLIMGQIGSDQLGLTDQKGSHAVKRQTSGKLEP